MNLEDITLSNPKTNNYCMTREKPTEVKSRVMEIKLVLWCFQELGEERKRSC